MTKYARTDAGIVLEVLDLPEGIDIADALHAETAALFTACPDKVLPGWLFDDSKFAAPAAIPADVLLSGLKVSLKALVDAYAETTRLQYITPGAGQAMTYSQKADEASRFLAATDPVASDYPMLNAEVGITALTIAEVAAVVSAAYAQWQAVGAAIEGIRLGGKKAIDDATTAGAAQAAFDAVTWPSI